MDCGLRFAGPLPSQDALDAFYASGEYWDKLAPPTNVQGVHAYSQSLERCNWTALHITFAPSQIADIGAGQGWMGLALDAVWRGQVLRYDFLEPDDKAAAAIMKSEIRPTRRRLHVLPAQADYDLIFLNQVLEHTVTPASLLAALKAGLRPGGYLYIEIPHRDDCYKENVFPHIMFMDAAVLERLCSLAGMEVVALESFGHMPSQGGFFAKLLRAGFRAAAILGLRQLATVLDRKLWGYMSCADGIWLRALVRKSCKAVSATS
jgi:SAM-dependent methyltransferase